MSELMGQRVLVTGGAGFIGSHVVDALVADGCRVSVVDDLSTGSEENLTPRAAFHRMDVGDPGLAAVLRKERINAIVHHAAQIDVRKSVADPRQDARTNIDGLLNLLVSSLACGVKGVVFASSGGVVYGEPEVLPVTETYAKGPLSPYGVSKLCSEYYLYYYHRVHGLPYIALRYGNVYGPRQNPHGEAGVVAIFAGAMIGRGPLTIYGDGEQTRDYVFVGDVAEANVRAIRALSRTSVPTSLDERAYNIGTGVETSVNELYRHLAGILGFRGEATHGADRRGELKRISLCADKAHSELGWRPAVSLPCGLEQTARSLRGA